MNQEPMLPHLFLNLSALSPKSPLGNSLKRAEDFLTLAQKAKDAGLQLVHFPELSLSGATLQDYYYSSTLQNEVQKALSYIIQGSNDLKGIILSFSFPAFIYPHLRILRILISEGKVLAIRQGFPILDDDALNLSAWFHAKEIKDSQNIEYFEINGLVYPVYSAFTPVSLNLDTCHPLQSDQKTALYLLSRSELYTLSPKSLLKGSLLLISDASPEIPLEAQKRQNALAFYAKESYSTLVYANASYSESSAEFTFDGCCLIFEQENLIAKDTLDFSPKTTSVFASILPRRALGLAQKHATLTLDKLPLEEKPVSIQLAATAKKLSPFYKEALIPLNSEEESVLQRILANQCRALCRRLEATGLKRYMLGVSGGLDSTLALSVLVLCYLKQGWDLKDIRAITLPGFGTSQTTHSNATALMDLFGVYFEEISIQPSCLAHFEAIHQDLNNHDICFENAQARERTQILMNLANREGALVLGTGDLSELALGWCTYNGDHMSMYAVNGSIPKTLIPKLLKSLLVAFIEGKYFEEERLIKIAKHLQSVIDSPISPELIPNTEGQEFGQKTEASLGPYKYHDFILPHFIDWGATKEELTVLAKEVYGETFEPEDFSASLNTFFRRFENQAFKRNCLPEGATVTRISPSPRTAMKYPSDSKLFNK